MTGLKSLAVLLLAANLNAQTQLERKALIGSQVVMVGSLVADGAESWNDWEGDRILRGADGRFSPARAIPIWTISTLGIIYAEHWLWKKPLPRWARWVMIGGNGVIAGGHFRAAFAGRE